MYYGMDAECQRIARVAVEANEQNLERLAAQVPKVA